MRAESDDRASNAGRSWQPQVSAKELELYADEAKKIRTRRGVAFPGRSTSGGAQTQPGGTDHGAGSANRENGSGANNAEGNKEWPLPQDLVGIALSGGGLRSATFNDGLLQAISHRGLLRYADYMCSVSGGGYTAADLIKRGHSSFTQSKSEPLFHDNDELQSGWQRGRDAKTGLQPEQRFWGLGQYLNNPRLFIPWHALNTLFGFLFYLGCLGAIGTLIAIVYRSLDEPAYRDQLRFGYGFRWGDEFFLAFLIPIALAAVTLTLALARWATSRISRAVSADRNGAAAATWVPSMFWVTLASFLCGLAVFLGNEYTHFSSIHQNGNFSLNFFAQWVILLAAIAQIVLFFQRDRLFRSEKPQASHWQRHLQHLVVYGSLGVLVFGMVHLMAQENISQYQKSRDLYLVRGEVRDWFLLQEVVQQVDPSIGSNRGLAKVAPRRHLAESAFQQKQLDVLHPRWAQSRSHRQIPPNPAESRVPSDTHGIAWPLPIFVASGQAIWRGLTGVGLPLTESGEKQGGPEPGSRRDGNAQPPSPPITWSFWQNIHADQNDVIERLNQRLETKDLARGLVRHLANHTVQLDETRQTVLDSPSILTFEQFLAVAEWLRDDKGLSLSEQDRRWLFRYIVSPAYAQTDSEPESAVSIASALEQERRERMDLVRANRLLLELAAPQALISRDVISTHVVQPHDQLARWNFLAFWSVLALVAHFVAGQRNRNKFVFDFYRRGIRDSFLAADPRPGRHDTGQRSDRDMALGQCKTWNKGLPFPLIQCAETHLKQMSKSDRSEVVKRSVVFTPLKAYRRHEEADIWWSNISDTKRTGFAEALRLDEAVAISGSAVTPRMTKNRVLALFMNGLGLSLGQDVDLGRSRGIDIREQRVSGVKVFITLTIAAGLLVILAHTNLGPARLGQLTFALLFYSSILLSHVDAGKAGFLRGLLVDIPSRHRFDLEAAGFVDDRSENRIHVTDGGFYDFLGVKELLRRRCDLIVVSDAANSRGENFLASLARMCQESRSEMGIEMVNLDSRTALDFQRLKHDEEHRVSQPILGMRVLYPELEADGKGTRLLSTKQGLLFYVQMAITENDPLEVQQIRNKFPSFPDEPTTNQFYTEEQISAYRDLGFHIGTELCQRLERWVPADYRVAASVCSGNPTREQHARSGWNRQPLFESFRERLVGSYGDLCRRESGPDGASTSPVAAIREGSTCYPAFGRLVRGFGDEQKDSLRALGVQPGNLRFDPNSETFRVWLDHVESHPDLLDCYAKRIFEDAEQVRLLLGGLAATARLQQVQSATNAVKSKVVKYLKIEAGSCELPVYLHVLALASAAVHSLSPSGRPSWQIGGRDELIQGLIEWLDPLPRFLSFDGRCQTQQPLIGGGRGGTLLQELSHVDVLIDQAVVMNRAFSTRIVLPDAMRAMPTLAFVLLNETCDWIAGVLEEWLDNHGANVGSFWLREQPQVDDRSGSLRLAKWLNTGYYADGDEMLAIDLTGYFWKRLCLRFPKPAGNQGAPPQSLNGPVAKVLMSRGLQMRWGDHVIG